MSTEEQVVDQEAEKQAAAQKKADEKAARDAAKAEAKRIKDAERIAAKEAKAAEKQAAIEAKEAEKQAKAAAKEAAKAEALAAREANRMPEQNGVRRPKPNSLCGRAWAIFDEVSSKNGAPASIGESMEIARSENLNESNVRAEYARWRKFFGVSGRIEAPQAPAAPQAVETSAE